LRKENCAVENVVKMEQIKPEEIVQILRNYGTIVTVEEARIILEFMWKLANLTLDQILSS